MKRSTFLILMVVAFFYLSALAQGEGFKMIGPPSTLTPEIASGRWEASLSGKAITRKQTDTLEKRTYLLEIFGFKQFQSTYQGTVKVLMLQEESGEIEVGIGDISFSVHGNSIWLNLMTDPAEGEPVEEVDYDCDLLFVGGGLKGACKGSGWVWDETIKEWVEKIIVPWKIVLIKKN